MNPYRRPLLDAIVSLHVAARALRRGEGIRAACAAAPWTWRAIVTYRRQRERWWSR